VRYALVPWSEAPRQRRGEGASGSGTTSPILYAKAGAAQGAMYRWSEDRPDSFLRPPAPFAADLITGVRSAIRAGIAYAEVDPALSQWRYSTGGARASRATLPGYSCRNPDAYAWQTVRPADDGAS
jgi:hypothetical protein